MESKYKHGSAVQVLTVIGLSLGVWLKVIYSQFSTKTSPLPFISEQNILMYTLSLLVVVMIFSLIYGLTHKWGIKVVVFFTVFFNLVILADTLYGRYFSSMISVTLFYQASMAADVLPSAIKLIKFKDVIFLLDYVVMGLFYIIMKKNGMMTKKRQFNGRILAVCLIVGFGALLIFTYKFKDVNKEKFIYERKNIARNAGLIYYHGYDVVDFVNNRLVKRKLTDEEVFLIEGLNGSKRNVENQFTGVAKGRNLIVIQTEAMMSFLIDYDVDGEPITPFLNELKKESIFLSQAYIQTANGNTADAEVLMNMSLMPTQRGSVYYEHSNNQFYTLPKLLAEEGYVSNSYHGYEGSFWNRSFMHPRMGFEKYHSLEDFDASEKIGWALSDVSFFKQSLDYSMQMEKDQYYDFMITLSSHYPYEAFYTGPFSDVGIDNVILKNYYNGIRYLDGAIEAFIADLKERGQYENSIIVIYGDHSGLFKDEAIAQVQRDNKSYNAYVWTKYLTTPVFIHVPGVTDEGILIDHVTGQIDILPTVLNLMGTQMPYTLGRDVFDEDYEGFVVKRFGDIITDEYIYINDEGQIYDKVTGERLNKELYKEDLMSSGQFLRGADMILQSDYFRRFME